MKAHTVLSLFSGCGGLDLGFVQAGFRLVAAYDHWKPAVRVHELNRALLGGEVHQRSLSLADGEVALTDLPDCDVVLGGPPCQGFSFAGRQFIEDPRNSLYRDFVRIVEHKQPLVFVMENVRGMEAMALDDAMAAFRAVGYRHTRADRALATNFGVAQRRERILIVGLRDDLAMEFEPPDEIRGGLFSAAGDRTILDAIGDLPEPVCLEKNGDASEVPVELNSHAYSSLPESVQRFVCHIPNGGCFRDAPKGLLPERLVKILENPAKYRSPRLFPKPDPDEPAQTVPADTNPSLGGVLAPDLTYPGGKAAAVDVLAHTKSAVYTAPRPSRRLTPREAARLQSFPDDFRFEGSLTTQFKLIGNAVPVRLARGYAEKIKDHLRAVASRSPQAMRKLG